MADITTYYSTPEIKIPVANDRKFLVVEEVARYVKEKGYSYLDIDGVRVQFDHAWALIRASNTGPDLTLRFEATTEEELVKIKKEFTDFVTSIL